MRAKTSATYILDTQEQVILLHMLGCQNYKTYKFEAQKKSLEYKNMLIIINVIPYLSDLQCIYCHEQLAGTLKSLNYTHMYSEKNMHNA